MKTQHLLFLFCAATVLSAYAAAPPPEPAVVALRFAAATDAFAAIKQKLGATAADAVSLVDEKRNTITLKADPLNAAIVRAFLAGFDHQPPEILIDATITRRLEATASSPARDEVLSRRTLFHQAARPEAFSIPGEHGPTRIELRMTQLSR
jgi:hypothetical protein